MWMKSCLAFFCFHICVMRTLLDEFPSYPPPNLPTFPQGNLISLLLEPWFLGWWRKPCDSWSPLPDVPHLQTKSGIIAEYFLLSQRIWGILAYQLSATVNSINVKISSNSYTKLSTKWRSSSHAFSPKLLGKSGWCQKESEGNKTLKSQK